MAAAANATALEEIDGEFKLSDEGLDLVNKRLDEAQGKLLSKCIVNIVGPLHIGLYVEPMVFGDYSCRHEG